MHSVSPLQGPTRPARPPYRAAAMEREGEAMNWLSRTTRKWLPAWPQLSPTDLLRDLAYRRLWTSILISSFGGQVTMLALPLTAAVLLRASPTQMRALIFVETLPFVLFSLPSGAEVAGPGLAGALIKLVGALTAPIRVGS